MRTSPLNRMVPPDGGATFEEYCGWEIVSAYGDPREEYDAVVRAAGVLDVSYAGKLRVTGRDRVRYLNNMLSNDVRSLRPGSGCHAVLLTHQGRTESDVFVYSAEEELWLEGSPAGSSRLLETLSRFIVADDVTVEDWTDRLAILSVQGPGSAGIAGNAAQQPLEGLAPLAFRRFGNGAAWVVRRDRTGCGGFDFWMPPDDAASLWQRWIREGVSPVGHLALNWLRTEAGIPWFGADINESRLPMEVGLAPALSYTKGCYRGQEIVARVTYRGRFDRAFGGIALGTSDPPRTGAEVRAGETKVGEITSAAFSPALGCVLALAILKQEFVKPDQEVEVVDGESLIPARVVGLPVARAAHHLPRSL